ncbi:hypothetical protein ACFX14_039622 [Malus domestica]
MNRKFVNATFLLQPQIKQILDKHRPHCHVADTFFPWATDVAAKFDIPMILFHGIGFFALCASLSVVLYELHAKLSSDSEVFTIPNFPMEIKLTRSQMPTFPKQSSKFTMLFKKAMAGGETSYGFILLEIAAGLKASGQEFIWVVKREKNDKEEWLIEGFEERLEGKGLIIRGWAPQVPFYNEKLVTKILKTGVAVGAKQWGMGTFLDVKKEASVKREAIEKVVNQVMVSEE